MKRLICLFLGILLMISFPGCKKQSEEIAAATDVVENNQQEVVAEVPEETVETKEPVVQKEPEALPPEPNESEKTVEVDSLGRVHETVIKDGFKHTVTYSKFNYEDCVGLKKVKIDDYAYSTFFRVDFTYQYDLIQRYLELGGLVVAGRAVGERTGVLFNDYTCHTETQFEIEKVFLGEIDQKTITIREGYYPDFGPGNDQVKGPCLVESNYCTRLRNGQLVLLVLQAKNEERGTYSPAYYSLPLQEGYDQYSDEYLTELLDYYRGEDSAYKERYASYLRWPKSTLNNEEMLEKLSDNIMVRLAADYKIVLWPQGHAKYETVTLPAVVMTGLEECSRP